MFSEYVRLIVSGTQGLNCGLSYFPPSQLLHCTCRCHESFDYRKTTQERRHKASEQKFVEGLEQARKAKQEP